MKLIKENFKWVLLFSAFLIFILMRLFEGRYKMNHDGIILDSLTGKLYKIQYGEKVLIPEYEEKKSNQDNESTMTEAVDTAAAVDENYIEEETDNNSE